MALVSLTALLTGLIVGFYWGRVLKLVRKTRKTTGQSAHLLPPEPLGRAIRLVWYPAVAAWVLVPIAIAFWPSPPAFFARVFSIVWLEWVGVAGALACLLLTMRCWRKMGRDWRMGIDPNEKNNLIVTGPFAYVRHPIYALQQLFAIFCALAVPVPAMFVVAVIELVFLQWEARREERHLLNVHGETYSNYMRTTGRFVPRLARR